MSAPRPPAQKKSPSHDPFQDPVSSLEDTAPAAIALTATYGEALRAMRERRSGSVLVLKDGKLAGIFTERDVLNACLLEETALDTPIERLMTPKPLTVRPESTLAQAIAAMHGRRVRNLPVVDAEGRPHGLLGVGQLIRYLAAHFPAEVVNLPPSPGQISEEVEGA